MTHAFSLKKIYLRLIRQRWKEKGTTRHYSNEYNLHKPGMKTTGEFRDFYNKLVDDKLVNFTTIGVFFHLPPQTVYYWYHHNLSGYTEAVESKEWGKNNFSANDKWEKLVLVLKPENFGEQMSVDEKMIDEEFYTVITNRQTGKIALLAETLTVTELNKLIDKAGQAEKSCVGWVGLGTVAL